MTDRRNRTESVLVEVRDLLDLEGGLPSAADLEQLTRKRLLEICRAVDLAGVSRLRKAPLAERLAEHLAALGQNP